MKRIKLITTIFMLTAFVLSCVNVNAQCDKRDDFVTLPDPTGTVGSVLITETTDAGWSFTNACGFKGPDTGVTGSGTNLTKYRALQTGEKAVCLNGYASVAGTITSPVLSGGCASIAFNYAARNSSTTRKVHIYITQDETQSWETTVDLPVAASATRYEYSIDNINVTGSFQLHIDNIMAKSGTPSWGDDVIIWNICMTDCAPPLNLAIPEFTISGDKKTEDSYWMATVGIDIDSDTEGASIRYTTDGSDPSATSALYEAPFTLTATTQVKAIGIHGDLTSIIADTLISIAGPQSAALPFEETFSGSLGDWYSYSAAGDDQVWNAEEEEDETFAKMSGADENETFYENEDWLISPAFTAEEGHSIAFSFKSARLYDGEPLALKYSTDYFGVGDPTPATWTDISDSALWPAEEDEWTESGEIRIDTVQPVRFAFVYTSTSSDAADWKVGNILADEVAVSTVDATVPTVPTGLTAGEVTETTIALSWTASNDNVAVAGYTLYLGNDSIDTVTGTSYTFSGLTAATEYTVGVEAFDAAGNRSAKATVTQRTLNRTGIPGIDESIRSVYPNPFGDYIVIEAAAAGTAVICDLSGRPALTARVQAGSNRIETSALAKGVYVLYVGENTVKIVK